MRAQRDTAPATMERSAPSPAAVSLSEGTPLSVRGVTEGIPMDSRTRLGPWTLGELREMRPEELRRAFAEISDSTLEALTDDLHDAVVDIKSDIDSVRAGRQSRGGEWLARAGNARRYKSRLLNLCLEERGRRKRSKMDGSRIADVFMSVAEEWLSRDTYDDILREAERVAGLQQTAAKG